MPAWSALGRRSGARGWAHTTRASPERLRRAPVVLEYAAPLLEHGRRVSWTGAVAATPTQEAEAACAAEQLGLRLLEIRRSEPYEGARDHHLHVFEKVAETPARFPRRAGWRVSAR